MDYTEYVASLRHTAAAYRTAADAPGLRKDAAAYLHSESDRLEREAEGWQERQAEREASRCYVCGESRIGHDEAHLHDYHDCGKVPYCGQ